MPLCSICSRLDVRVLLFSLEADNAIGQVNENDYYWERNAGSWRLKFRHQSDIYAVRDAALAGCELCSLLWATFDRKGIVDGSKYIGKPLVLYAIDETRLEAAFVAETKSDLGSFDLSLPPGKQVVTSPKTDTVRQYS